MPASVARSRFGQMCQPSERRQRETERERQRERETERETERKVERIISLVLKLEHLVFSLDFRAEAG